MRHLLNHLLYWLLSPSMLMFAAAAVVPEIGGASDGTNSASEDSGVEDSANAGSGVVEDTAASSKDNVSDPSTTDPLEAKDKTSATNVDQRALPPKVREMLDQLKTSDPKAHGFLKDVLFRDRAFKQELPGGLPELKALKATVAELGDGGVEAIKAERSEWNAIDEAYNAADPKFLDIMVDANPESFNKIAPLMIGKFAQTDPQGYQRHMAGILVATLQNANMLGTLNFASRLLAKGDAEGASAELKNITDWVGGIDELAKSQPKVPEKNVQQDTRQQELDDREFKVWAQETATPINQAKTAAIKKELAQFAKGQQIDDETYEIIEGQALRYVDALLNADPKFRSTFESYIQNRDRDGVTKFMKSRLQELLPSKPGKPGPVEKAFKLIFRSVGSSSSKPAQRTPAGVKPGAPAAPKGWEKVAKAPAPHEIDMKASPFEMRFKQAAVLRTGKKVFWGANAPA